MEREPQDFSRVLSSMCTPPHPEARRAAEAFLATNPGDPGTFPAVATLERRVVERLASIVGLEDPHGYVASGGTEANVQAVRAARNLADVDDPNVVLPASAHFSFTKAASVLDVERREVPLDDDHRIDLHALSAAVDADTALVVAVAGSTEYGRIDPIEDVAAIAADAGASCHVDAAWGGFYLPFTDHRWRFDQAPIDSMTVDPHKAGRAAIPAGGFLAREATTLDALAVETPYLASEAQPTLLGTRSGAGVAAADAALAALWPEGYREEYDRASALATWLADALHERGHDVVEPTLPMVTASIDGDTYAALRERGWRISRTAAGELRVVIMPHVTQDRLRDFLADLDTLDG